MNYFVIQVLTKSENRFLRLAKRMVDGTERPTRRGAGGVRGEDAEPPRSDSGDVRTTGRVELPEGFVSGALPGRLLWPRRRLTIRRKGKEQSSLAPIFPGYIFYEADEVSPDVYWAIKGLTGFVRFLKNEDRLEKLSGPDRELLVHFLSYGEVVDRSIVYFDENNRIRVKSGPMKGLEGQIVKVDKRKRRAKIRLSMYSDRFLVDFGFELLESAEDHGRQSQ